MQNIRTYIWCNEIFSENQNVLIDTTFLNISGIKIKIFNLKIKFYFFFELKEYVYIRVYQKHFSFCLQNQFLTGSILITITKVYQSNH